MLKTENMVLGAPSKTCHSHVGVLLVAPRTGRGGDEVQPTFWPKRPSREVFVGQMAAFGPIGRSLPRVSNVSGSSCSPDALQAPNNRSPNNGLQYSYGADYRTPRWIYILDPLRRLGLQAVFARDESREEVLQPAPVEGSESMHAWSSARRARPIQHVSWQSLRTSMAAVLLSK